MRMKLTIKRSGFMPLLLVLVLLLALVPAAPLPVSAASSYLLSQDRPAYASGTEGANTPDLAFDSNASSRWSSSWGSDPNWIYVDLGSSAAIDRVVLRWENAYATAYKIQVSADEMIWNDIYSTSAGDGGTDELTVSGTGRYVRMYATARSMAAYGVSLYEFEVYGTGGVNPPPVQLGANVALNKPVTASSYETSDYLPPGSTLPKLAVDGDGATRWSSNASDNEWIYVDLGSVHTLGRVIISWEAAAGRTYDIQVSNDASSWTTIYREMHGDGGTLNLPVYAQGRYVRMKGISRATSFGYSIFEFQVYDYVTGEAQPVYTIPELPQQSTVAVGGGSYTKNDMSIPQPKYPLYKSDSLTAPLPSNDWWQSIMINKLGNGIVTLPLKSKYTKQGLSVLNPGAGYVNGLTQAASGSPDLYLMASNINTSSMSNRITAYGDWSADAVLSDGATDKMKTTFVKGSPYLYSQFSDPASPEIYLPVTARFFDDSGNTILAADGTALTGDHIGIEVTNTNGAPTPSTVKRTYGVFAPAGTTFKKVGAKLKIQLGSGQSYLSLAAMPAASDLNYFYQHGYAFVTGTTVTYSFNEITSDATTHFNVSVTQKRSGFPNTTLMALLPHQWKASAASLNGKTYPSIRGTLKLTEGNSFSTVNKFYGIVPQFTEPGDESYSRETLRSYLAQLDADTSQDLMKADAYWQGKKLHPLAMGVLIADQIGDTAYKNLFLSRMKTILSDWYTYTPGETDYYFDYNTDWGTLIYKNSEFGANSGITDHHFTYGYYVFASAVLATYDSGFRDEYSGMVEQLIRDYANPSKNDPLYPFLRNFDPYEGHSWAGGYADNDDGNNQEAAGESLFGWVGEYMWSQLTGNTAYRDTAIMGFTTELSAVEQYWFNYDGDNWLPEFNHKSLGQVYGASNFFGTFFNGNPVYVYGIHWLPTSEYLTSYGFDKDKAAGLYNGFVADNGGPEEDWYHIVWPIQSLSDPQAVLNKWNASIMQQNEVFNTYWFVHSMADLGQRTKDIWATGGASATVYRKGNVYRALVWNPGDAPVTVSFRNAQGAAGSVTVPAKSLVKADPTVNGAPIGGGSGSDPGSNPGGGASGANLALGKSVTSSANPLQPAAGAVDGDKGTRWESAFSDPQWIQVDLGSVQTVSRVVLNWEGAYAKSYTVQASANGTDWSTVYSTTTGDGGIDDLALSPVSARYIKVNGTERGTQYGYSLWELEVYGSGSSNAAPPALTADTTQNYAGQPIEITFSDNAAWRSGVSGVTVDGTALSASQYALTAGKLTLNAGVFPAAGTYSVTVSAAGYTDAAVQQTVAASAAVNLALNKTTTASESPYQPASLAVDGDKGTRWESAFSDPQWLQVDLGAVQTVSRVVLNWESAYGKAYTIQTSVNGTDWTTVYTETAGDGGIDDLSFAPASARYIKLNGTERGTVNGAKYGYSLWELEVYGLTAAAG
ncbi:MULTISPECIES: discoidin domain-containing protein [Paenibacillus]|uniref:galactose-binding domain-containing protein n=1 Tax=Paenibacillus TaxID=44249 RepID=UPI001F3AD707|nr:MULTISPECIES: discoidin domain-containing protein [Paenibacillus]